VGYLLELKIYERRRQKRQDSRGPEGGVLPWKILELDFNLSERQIRRKTRDRDYGNENAEISGIIYLHHF